MVTQLPSKTAAVLVYSRPILVFGGMVCALAVMWTRDPAVYTLGVCLLLLSMTFDLIDGWFSTRYRPNAPLAHLADRIMDKLVYSIIFPVVAVGTMWRLSVFAPDLSRNQLLHAIFVLLLCVTVLIRDNFAAFMRSFALRQGTEPESIEFTRLRTIVAAPVAALLYAHAFYVPQVSSAWIYRWTATMGSLSLRTLFFIEILFLIINLGSIAAYCRKYGTVCLDELCFGDQVLRRKILSVLPNALTIMNAMMGLIAVFFAYQGRFREMYFMIIGAATFDKLDGSVARKLGLTEPLPGALTQKKVNLGNLMDDFADGISFCIAPAWIFYIAMTRLGNDRFAAVPVGWIALLYAIAGIGRLIYFTLDKSPIPGFFKGLPSPAAALLVLAPIVIFDQAFATFPGWIGFWGYFVIVTIVFSAFIMNFYPLRYMHMGRAMSRNPWFGRITAIVLTVTAFTPFLGQVCLGFMIVYVLSPLVTGRVDPHVAARESRVE
ncbi:MAG: CDP-alcohol phosphatidyltransferase [Desulfatitalea sp. BRH_c12]|nr:MAG: CDP-alcohol phosphatidyltransferase [Desulfatitalea sp. BRH_c12]